MVSRKRSRSEVDADAAQPPPPNQPDERPDLLHRLRNCWEFASLMQFITIFGRLMKIDEDFDIDDLENECLKTEPSEKLLEIGLCLLKWVSSHRGLTLDNFNEYTRRQYNAKAPHIDNPFGHAVEPKKFSDFDVFVKLRVLHQLSLWTFWNPDRIRSKMPEQREVDQTQWRVEELGYDRRGRYYFILDDNRLYRRTDPPIPARKSTKPKLKSRSSRALRASKRRKASDAVGYGDDPEEGSEIADQSSETKWECIAVRLSEYDEFLGSIANTRDADEKILRDRIVNQVLPVIQETEEEQERKILKRQKEIASSQLMIGAKRSSRLAQKFERERIEREAAEAARQYEINLAIARKGQQERQKLEDDRESRVMTREQRLKDREQKRLLQEVGLEKAAESKTGRENGEVENGDSNGRLKPEREDQTKSPLTTLREDQWIFDCSGCGLHGMNLDDGSHSVACEKCNVWQHSRCIGIAQVDAESEDFHFVCKGCKQREEEAKLPKLPPLRFKIMRSNPAAEASNEHQTPMLVTKNSAATLNAHTIIQSASQLPPSLPHAPLVSRFSRSPERRPQAVAQNHFGSSPPRAPFSPSKSVNGLTPPRGQQGKFMVERYSLPPAPQMCPPGQFGSFDASQRPLSSHSRKSPNLPSPIRNHPSMSPTQGNHDVGLLAGFPLSAPNGTAPFTPSGPHRQRPSTNYEANSSACDHLSFSMATPVGSWSSPPHSSNGMHLSGISPTKNSYSPRPLTSGGVTSGTSVVPPIRALEPSPKLMGRSSPDAPVPSPTKCMTPEQEERRHRENI